MKTCLKVLTIIIFVILLKKMFIIAFVSGVYYLYFTLRKKITKKKTNNEITLFLHCYFSSFFSSGHSCEKFIVLNIPLFADILSRTTLLTQWVHVVSNCSGLEVDAAEFH